MKIFVYMLRCSDISYYVGFTRAGLDARIADHQSGRFPGYTNKRRPVELVWSADFLWLKDAIACERRIKGWRREKKEARSTKTRQNGAESSSFDRLRMRMG